MKALKNIWIGLFVAITGGISLNSCQDPQGTESKSELRISEELVKVSKLGVDYKGEIPSVTVSSSVYWQIEMTVSPAFAEDEDPWVTMSTMGGSGITNLEAVFKPNATDEERTVTLKFNTLTLPVKTVVFKQSPDTEDAIFYTDDFGDTSAQTVSVNEFDEWNYSGIGVDMPTLPPFYYSGTGAVVDSSNESTGEGASGGNNILLEGDATQFILNNIRHSDQLDLQLSFMASKDDGDFSTEEFIVEISSDGRNWHKIEYSRPADGDWKLTTFDFTLADNYKYLFVRFRTTTESAYRIDDIAIKDSSIGGPVMTLDVIPPAKTGATFPVVFPFSAALMESSGYQQTFNQDKYIISPTEPFARLEYVMDPLSEYHPDHTDRSGFTWVTGGSGQPYVTSQWRGDYWLFRIHVDLAEAGSLIDVALTSRSTANGLKYYRMQYYHETQDDWFDMEQTKEVPEKKGDYYTHALSSGGHDFVTGYFRLPETIEDGDILIRFYASSTVKPGGAVITIPEAGTNRLSGGADGQDPTINLTAPAIIPSPITIDVQKVTDNVITVSGSSPAPVTFTVKGNYFWTLSTTDLDWAEVKGWRGKPDEDVTITLIPQSNDGEIRRGKITIKSDDVEREIIVVQGSSGAEPPVQGLPQTWTLTGFTNYGDVNPMPTDPESREYIWIYSKYVDSDTKGATVKWTKGSGIMTGKFYTGGSQIVLTDGVEGDGWLFTIPVKDMAANTTVKVSAAMRSSGQGARFFILEHSTNGIEWTQHDLITSEVYNLPTLNDPILYPYTATYTKDVISINNSAGSPFSKEIVFTNAVAKGNYYVRLRVASDINHDLNRYNAGTTGGTHRLVGTAKIEVVE